MKFHSCMWAYSPQEEVDAKGLARAVRDWANWARSGENSCVLRYSKSLKES